MLPIWIVLLLCDMSRWLHTLHFYMRATMDIHRSYQEATLVRINKTNATTCVRVGLGVRVCVRERACVGVYVRICLRACVCVS